MTVQSVVELQEVRPGVVQVTMQDREGSNSFTPRLVSGLIEAFKTIAAGPEIRAVILTGYGNYFCSGGTREMLTAMHEGRARFSDTDIYRLALECEVPVIAAMQG